MYSRLHPSCRNRAIWLAHPSTAPELFQLTGPGQDATGTATTNYGVNVLIAGADAPAQLLGIPIYFSEKCQELGTEGDLCLADFSKYYIALKNEVVLDRDVSTGFTTAQIAFRAIARVDGAPMWSAAMTPRRGSDSLSWFITLADRSS
jgi:HK97 family phage major capsid protein